MEAARCFGDEVLFVTVGGVRFESDLRVMAESEHTTVPEMIEAYLKSDGRRGPRRCGGFPDHHGCGCGRSLVDFASADDTIRKRAAPRRPVTRASRRRLS